MAHGYMDKWDNATINAPISALCLDSNENIMKDLTYLAIMQQAFLPS